MPATATRTLNPLHFEDLEPKRFEDLARQLAYDFKPWRQLEATGRGGSDDGFDARGFEIVPSQEPDPIAMEAEDSTDDSVMRDRLWLIQCKRERAIGPTKMREYLDSIPAESRKDLHGIVFVAACDFSKKTRDAFRLWCSDNGINEPHIWGKAEIEDLLFLPKNDHLLFAYFGISIQFRKQKAAVNIRRNTTIKRKIERLMNGDRMPVIAIIRDISDEKYPYIEVENIEKSTRLWRVRQLEGKGIGGLRVLERKHNAYYNRQTGEWDLATGHDQSFVDDYDNPWHEREESREEQDRRCNIHERWLSLPKDCQATITFISEIPYSEILEIDDVGDHFSKLPTVYVNFRDGRYPIAVQWEVKAEITGAFITDDFQLSKSRHIKAFPDDMRDLEWERDWAERNGVVLQSELADIALEPPEWIANLRKPKEPEEPN